jgi:hypothetical protein
MCIVNPHVAASFMRNINYARDSSGDLLGLERRRERTTRRIDRHRTLENWEIIISSAIAKTRSRPSPDIGSYVCQWRHVIANAKTQIGFRSRPTWIEDTIMDYRNGFGQMRQSIRRRWITVCNQESSWIISSLVAIAVEVGERSSRQFVTHCELNIRPDIQLTHELFSVLFGRQPCRHFDD